MGYGYYYGYGVDWTYLLVVIGIVISLLASARVKSTFNRYSKVRSTQGLTAAAAAQMILQRAGIYNVRIQPIAGNLTDNYDPTNKVLHLSQSTMNSTSVAAIGVAAHECGHAIQDAKDYTPMRIRGSLVPAVNIGSKTAIPLILIGFVMGFFKPLITIGILMFSLTVLFQLVTLPVEFDASRRAIAILSDSGLLIEEEVKGARKVLNAAALTYVAAAAASALQLLRLILLSNRRR